MNFSSPLSRGGIYIEETMVVHILYGFCFLRPIITNCTPLLIAKTKIPSFNAPHTTLLNLLFYKILLFY